MSQVTHLALDSGLVDISGEGLHLEDPPSGVIQATLPSHEQEFCVGNREFAHKVVRHGPNVELNERYGFRGRALFMGSREHPNDAAVRVAAWEGQEHSLYTLAFGTPFARDASRMFGVLNLLEIDEVANVAGVPSGIVLKSRDRSKLWFERGPRLVKFIPGLGLLEIVELTEQVVRELPRWSGAPVPGGELFTDHEREARYFVLVSRTARTLVMPEADVTDAALEVALSRLHVEWRRS